MSTPAVQRFGSGGPWEQRYGYSRVVRAGDLLLTAGCTATVDGAVTGIGDPRAQALTAFGIAVDALEAAGAARYVVTDITKDGTMRGPNLDLLREVCDRTDRPVIASGGVSKLDDLRALATLEPIGVEGVIAGKALYAGCLLYTSDAADE